MKNIIIIILILYKSMAGMAQKSDLDSLVKSSPKLPALMEFKSQDGTIFKSNNIAFTDKTNTRLDKTKKPIYMMEGKQVSEFELNRIDPKDIEKLQMYKGETAIMRYGEEAKNGVIVITLKKKSQLFGFEGFMDQLDFGG